ncbi:MAG TPA: hypothetical protein VKJ45_25585 [Blastocatellia bacterium]|nr:hypothetical protein [Blastocatellia bacterium]
MKFQSSIRGIGSRSGSLLGIAGFAGALGLSILVLRLWGDHILVRALLGSCWGGYAFFSLGGTDIIRMIREARRNK